GRAVGVALRLPHLQGGDDGAGDAKGLRHGLGRLLSGARARNRSPCPEPQADSALGALEFYTLAPAVVVEKHPTVWLVRPTGGCDRARRCWRSRAHAAATRRRLTRTPSGSEQRGTRPASTPPTPGASESEESAPRGTSPSRLRRHPLASPVSPPFAALQPTAPAILPEDCQQ